LKLKDPNQLYITKLLELKAKIVFNLLQLTPLSLTLTAVSHKSEDINIKS